MATPKRKRDYAAEYRRRQELAQQRGFRNYYERRTRVVPGQKIIDPEVRARRAGHRGTAGFLASLREGDLILCDVRAVDRDPKTGLYKRIDKTVIPADGGGERHYVLRRLSRQRLIDVIAEELRRGVIFSPSPSLDQRQLVTADERPDE